MSRRPGDKAAQNQQTIKSLLKLEANKNCADCKKNKHPRWASWNLGIFICIRCSGIHRGMGTHISRVKSVDLDAWTDEQLQSVMRWGNARANKYWESKLAPGHVPSDAKIENFIRTKYESKRWIMDGPMPDPSTLGEDGGDDNVPLNVVQEKAKLDRSSSQRAASGPGSIPPPHSARSAQSASFDLMGGDPAPAPPVRPSTTDTSGQVQRPPPPKTQTPSQLLGGLDFLGGPPERPASASSKPTGGMSRPDLKQSILSLYATAPKPQPQPQASPDATSHNRQQSFGGLGGSTSGSSSGLGGMNDAFAGLNFGSTSTASRPQQSQGMKSSFSNFAQPPPPAKSQPAAPQLTSHPLSGGGFFDAGPKPPPKPAPARAVQNPLAARKISNASDGFGDFSSAMASAPAAPPAKPASSSNGLLDFTSQPMPSQPAPPAANAQSVFNLSQPKTVSNPSSQKPPQATNFAAGLGNDPWGANEWSTPAAPAAAPAKPAEQVSSPVVAPTAGDFGWGNSPTKPTSGQSGWGAMSSGKVGSSSGGWGDSDAWASSAAAPAPAAASVKPEEDFGGWASNAEPAKPAPKPSSNTASTSKPFAPSDDPWANVWQ